MDEAPRRDPHGTAVFLVGSLFSWPRTWKVGTFRVVWKKNNEELQMSDEHEGSFLEDL